MSNPSRYRNVNFVGGRILEAREMALLQSIAEGKDANGDIVSAGLSALYRQGALFNISIVTNNTVVTISPVNVNYPMMVFIRDRWEIITTADFPALDVGANRTIYLNWALRIVTSSEDGSLIDVTTGQSTANVGELDLSFSVTDTSATALNATTQLEKNTSPVHFLVFVAGGPPLVVSTQDNANPPSYGSLHQHGLVALSTATSGGVGVAIDDPILNAARTPLVGSVVDASVRVPVPVSGVTNTDGSARYSLTTDPGGISSDKIIVPSVTERLTDYLANLASQITTFVANFNAHVGKALGLSNTHPMPTYTQVGAAPASHTSLSLGVAGSHPAAVNSNTGGFLVNDTAASSPAAPAFGLNRNGTQVVAIQHNGDIASTLFAEEIVAPGGTGITYSGPLATVSQALVVLKEHVNQTSHANPHGLAAADLSCASQFTANGYIKLPGGLIMQWAIGAYDANIYNTAVNTLSFPIEFPNACLWTSVSTMTTGTDFSEEALFTVTSYNRSGVSFFNARNADHNTNPNAPAVFAIGF